MKTHSTKCGSCYGDGGRLEKKVNTGEKKLPPQEIVSLVTFYVTKFEKLKKEGS